MTYVTLDLSNPFVPGAFNFDPDECVDGIRCPGSRLTVRVDQASTPPIAPVRRPTAPALTDRRPGPPDILGDWLIDLRRSHAPAEATASLSEDH